MLKGTLASIITLAYLCVLCAPVFARDMDAAATDFLAFTPTGDALWDTYAQEILARLGDAKTAEEVVDTSAALPDDLLESWEGEFGGDPRYWELRYWCAKVNIATKYGPPELNPLEMLELAEEQFPDNINIRLLAALERIDQHGELWDSMDDRAIEPGRLMSGWAVDLPEFASKVDEIRWFEDRDMALADKFVAACPDEAWAHYVRAIKHFEYGQRGPGMEQLTAGNMAPGSHFPQPFPMSFINQQLATGKACGNSALVGLVRRGQDELRAPTYRRLWDGIVEQQFAGSYGDGIISWVILGDRLVGMQPTPPDVLWEMTQVYLRSFEILLDECETSGGMQLLLVPFLKDAVTAANSLGEELRIYMDVVQAYEEESKAVTATEGLAYLAERGREYAYIFGPFLEQLVETAGAKFSVSAINDAMNNALEESATSLERQASPLSGDGSAPVTAAELLAYTPTGDALWDKYAQALLEHFPDITLEQHLTFSRISILADAELAAWEAEFGDDPRYWELRYFNAKNDEVPHETYNDQPFQILKHAVEIGSADANVRMLLYNDERWWWENFSGLYPSGALFPEDLAMVPEPTTEIPAHLWFEQKDIALVDELVADCPDDSWAWYYHAFKQFEYGEWESGLDSLRRGNNAPSNVMPLPFPLSFVVQHMNSGEPMGNEVAAGIVAGQTTMWPLQNFIRIKDQMKNQQLRLALGASPDEVKPWLEFSVRFGSMDNSTAIQWLVSVILAQMGAQMLLTDAAEAYSPEQRRALLTFHSRSYRIRDIVRYQMRDEQPDIYDFIPDPYNVRDFGGGLVTVNEDLREFRAQLMEEDPKPPLPSLEDACQYYRFILYTVACEYGECTTDARERFRQLQRLNFDTLLWPEEDQSTN